MEAADGSDDELIMACRNGEAEAWEHILQKYERLVYSIPLYLGLPHEDASDVTQITFTALIKSLNDLQQETSLKAWLVTVARRHSWRLLKKRRQAESSNVELDSIMEYATDLGMRATQNVETWEIIHWLDHGLSQLNERCQKLLRALYLESGEGSYEEISGQMSIPLGSIGPTRNRCLEQLRSILASD
jgi:RNA polymerase sigma factor (sigma-70 family)